MMYILLLLQAIFKKIYGWRNFYVIVALMVKNLMP